MARTRTKETKQNSGTCEKRRISDNVLEARIDKGPIRAGLYTCVDTLGRSTPHDLSISKYDTLVQGLSGTYDYNSSRYILCNNFVPSLLQSDLRAHFCPNIPYDSFTNIVARTNPSRPTASLPTFIGELKDLPDMIRHVGRTVLTAGRKGSLSPGKLAGHYLFWEFGMAPMISDIRKLTDFQNNVARRSKELDSLYRHGGLRRKIRGQESSVSQSGTSSPAESSIGLSCGFRYTALSKRKTWYTIRWLPTAPPTFHNQKEMRALARNLAYGLNAQALTLTAWELLPWSWLIDWFAGLQDYLQAHLNTVPAKPVSACAMRQSTTQYSFTPIESTLKGLKGGIRVTKYDTKERAVLSGSSSSGFPFLSGKQLSILGALYINRKVR